MKKVLLLLFTLASVMCYAAQNSATEDSGVVINGVRWATRNVDAPGTFAANPESAGQLFQWNRQQGWAATGAVNDWNRTPASGRWTAANDPCPPGWRVPTQVELQGLLDSGHTWTSRGGVRGTLFGAEPNQIFLPAVGWRNGEGVHNHAGSRGFFWGNAQTGGSAWRLRISSGETNVQSLGSRGNGFSVRCVAQ